MFEINWPDMSTEVFAAITAVIVLSVQLVLCFKVRKLCVRLIPVCLSAIAAAVCLALTFLSEGWDALGYLLLTMFSAGLLLVCGIGWLVWAIIKKLRR